MENGKLPDSELAPIAGGSLRKDAAAGFNAMNVQARAQGLELHPTGSMSSYRTYGQQVILWERYRAGTGNLAARPGQSNHGYGLAVDFATPQMRQMVDRIGAAYGWSKQWSDAPSEWWHVCYQPGHYHGPDPGPHRDTTTPPPPPDEVTVMAIAVGTMTDGRLEVFVQDEKTGQVWHAYNAKTGGWAKDQNGKTWFSMGTPGK